MNQKYSESATGRDKSVALFNVQAKWKEVFGSPKMVKYYETGFKAFPVGCALFNYDDPNDTYNHLYGWTVTECEVLDG